MVININFFIYLLLLLLYYILLYIALYAFFIHEKYNKNIIIIYFMYKIANIIYKL